MKLISDLEDLFEKREFGTLEAAQKVVDEHIEQAKAPEQSAAPISARLASITSMLRTTALRMLF